MEVKTGKNSIKNNGTHPKPRLILCLHGLCRGRDGGPSNLTVVVDARITTFHGAHSGHVCFICSFFFVTHFLNNDNCSSVTHCLDDDDCRSLTLS